MGMLGGLNISSASAIDEAWRGVVSGVTWEEGGVNRRAAVVYYVDGSIQICSERRQAP